MNDKACAAAESLATTVTSIGLLPRMVKLMKRALTKASIRSTTFVEFLSWANSLMGLQMRALIRAFLSRANVLMTWERQAIPDTLSTLMTWTEFLSWGYMRNEAVTRAFATRVEFVRFLFCVRVTKITDGRSLHEGFTHTPVIFPMNLRTSTLIL